mgnify:CR=1 FL=1
MATLASLLSQCLLGMEHNTKGNAPDLVALWQERAERLVSEHMPSGSGVDTGTTLDLESSTPERLAFTLSFHHMDDCGHYDGWTEHRVIVRPSFAFGMDVRVTGRNRNGIKDYLADIYAESLRADVGGWPKGLERLP